MSAEVILEELVALSRDVGREDRKWAILGEGNTSADIGDGTFWVKASGSQLGNISSKGFARVHTQKVLDLIDQDLSNDDVNKALESCVTAPHYKRPSVETFLHALCLTMGDAKWVGHTHTESVLSVVCSKLGAQPFMDHIYPDEIVVCGRNIAVVPYIDPGLHLARAVRDELKRFKEAHGAGPKLLLMVNHGPVALGKTATDVFNVLAMADKWARILVGSYALGGPQYMPRAEADRINTRPDEEYRRKQIAAR